MTLRIVLSRLAKILDQILNPPTDHLHKCPRCTQGVSPGDECCVHCGFSITVMDEQYGSDAVLLDRVTDAAGVLSEPELDRLNEALVEYERQFPQLFATVYCGALPQQSSLRQFGFWLLNRAAVCDVDATRPNEHGTALVLDIHGRAAFLLHGYLVECYLSDADNAWILKKGQRAWNQGRWADGILAVLEAMSDRLRKRAAEAAKNPAKFNPDRTPEEPQPPRFRRIRQGHRRAENCRTEPKK